MKKVALYVLAIALFMPMVGWLGSRIVANVQFDRSVEGYLKRAADANTIDLAATQLTIAVENVESQNLTSGYTSILWTTPDEDVEFWYTNLSASLEELRHVSPTATDLEKTNVLMKLRETLLDEGEEGTAVTAPPGISVFPHNSFFFAWGMAGLMLAGVGLIVGFMASDTY